MKTALERKIVQILTEKPGLDPLDIAMELGIGLEECAEACKKLIDEGAIGDYTKDSQ